MDTNRYAEQLATRPNDVLDAVIKHFHLKNDAALSRVLDLAPPVVSKIRHNTISLGPSVLVRILEATELHIRELYELTTKKA
ncbi:MAG: hypothetical protein ACXU7H_06135 [Burkholderiaceae bacterium]